VLRSTDPVVTMPCPLIGLNIAADNITLNGHELSGAPTIAGIVLEARTGVTVRNCKITASKRAFISPTPAATR
jgi:hypothetical protein